VNTLPLSYYRVQAPSACEQTADLISVQGVFGG